MSILFEFEKDFVGSLRCIPMQVRFNLDTCGVKLKLAHWNQLTTDQRQSLVEMPCHNPDLAQKYKEYIQNLIISQTGQPASELTVDENPPWMNPLVIPAAIEVKAKEFGVKIALNQWENLNPLQRFALIKLSRAGHENKNFYPALQEFAIV